jgi:hypothetical protein
MLQITSSHQEVLLGSLDAIIHEGVFANGILENILCRIEPFSAEFL